MADRFSYGFKYLLVAKRDSNGYPMGQLATPNSPTVDTEYSALVLNTGISYTPPEPTIDTVSERGGGALRKKKQIGVNDFSDGSFVLSSSSDALQAMATGGVVDTATVSGWTQIPANDNAVPAPSLFLMFIGQTEDENGNEKWIHRVLPNAQIKRTGGSGLSQDAGENPNPVEYTITASNSSRGIDGRLFSAGAMAVEDDKELKYDIIADNPLMLTTYVDDGSTGAANLPYKMSAATPVTGATSPNSSTESGVTAAVTSYNATSGAVALTAADSGDIWVFLYEVALGNYTAVS